MSIIGQEINKLDTPVLWVDLDIMQRNILLLSKTSKDAGLNWRPHTKGIKIPAIAHKLLDAGAIGVTCAKLGEAEVMAAGGIKDILVANEIVGEIKIARLISLRHHADVMVCVDDLTNARDISRAAKDAGVRIRVLMELDTGMERSGRLPGPAAVEFARQVADLPGLEFSGVMGWEGHCVRIMDPLEKRIAIETSVGKLIEMADECRSAGLPVHIVSCGGTGTFHYSSRMPGVTEIQAGGGIFGDLTYHKWGAGVEFSLFVMAAVNSIPLPGRAVINGGRKTMNSEYTVPEARDIPGAKLSRFSAEHAVLEYDPAKNDLKVGDILHFIVGYGDLTMFLHNQLIGVRNGKVEMVWDVLGRGKLT
jgi:D-serine deaminase-like pyridoxal phosphate-dependent protein